MKKFEIIVAGCGSMSKEWVKYALSREDCSIAGLVDIKKENAEALANKYDLDTGIFTELNEALQAARANLVFDVTLPGSHKDIVTTALKAGCDVFGEKPMAASLQEAAEMVKTAADTGKTYAVMQNRRFHKNGRAFRHLLSSGVIGKPGFMCSDFFLGPHFGGFRDLMDSPLLLDMSIHTFDQARFYSGADPISVYCHEFNPEGSWYSGNASAVCIFEFTGGLVFNYRGSWCAEGCNTSWDAAWRVIGSKGTACWDGEGEPYCEIALPSGENHSIRKTRKVKAEYVWNGRDGHFGCLDEMFASLLEDRKAETDCTDNIKSIAMVYGAIQSAKEGRKISLDF